MKQKLGTLKLNSADRSKQSISAVEQSIITLQKSFLTPGIHCITVSNVQHGRDILKVCLDSLLLYTDIGHVSLSTYAVPDHYRDLCTEIRNAQEAAITDGGLEEFLLKSFQCDFLILEYTQELMEQPWFGRFEYLLNEYSISDTIPTVMFLYKNQALNRN